jgi:hypothetical protein
VDELLQRSEKGGGGLLSRIITGDKTWVHHYNPLTKKKVSGMTSVVATQ